MQKIKILYIHHAQGWGGAPNSLIKLINSLDKERFEISVLLLKHSIVADVLKKNNINFTVSESFFYKKYYRYFTHSEAGYIKWYQVFHLLKHMCLWFLSRYYFAKKELVKFDFDIVHLNSSVLTDWLAPASRYGKVIMHVREPFRKGKLDILHYFFKSQMQRYADHIIAISEDNAKRVNITEKTTVIYNHAETPDKRVSDESYYSKKVLYLGGDAKIKGFFTLVEALSYINNDILIYFGGSYSNILKKKHTIKGLIKASLPQEKKRLKAMKKIDNYKNVVFIGLTQNVEDYYNEVSFLVSPFLIPHFSRPIIEAFLHKKPAIATDIEGMNEIIDQGINGLLVKNNNPEALAKAINYLSENPLLIKKLGEKGYEKAIECFSPQNVMKFSVFYESIL